MPQPHQFRRTTRRVVGIAAAIALGLAGAVAPVHPTPEPPALAAPTQAGDEGGTDALRKQLDEATRGYVEAQAALDSSVKRQKELAAHLVTVEADLLVHNRTIGELAGVAYRTGRLGPVSALLGADSPDGFLDRAARLDAVAANEDRQLRELARTRDEESRAKTGIEREIVEQRKQLAVMAKRKQQAEQALADAREEQARRTAANRSSSSGGSSTSGGSSRGSNSTTAKGAPRNSDGSWPRESCSLNDPTTSGCITPRTLHALKQAKAAGFTRYVSCYRSGGSGEHPKGRACDFAAQKNGFGGDATGGDRTYGNNLAAYFINNASRLGVLYVIWYREIWLPGSGWKSYSGAYGDPSSDHTNHVHLSMY